MRPHALTFAVFVSLMPIAGFAQQTTPEVSRAESKAWVKHTKNGDVFVTENSSFDFVRLLKDDGKGYSRLRVLHTYHNEWNEEREGVDGTVTVTAWNEPRANHEDTRWTFRATGNEGLSLQDLGMFQVSTWPCCSAPFEHTYFSLKNGKRLYTTNGQPLKGKLGQDSGLLTIDCYAGVHYTNRLVGFGAVGDHTNDAPTLQYGTDLQIKQRFTLRGHDYGDNFDVPTISVTDDGKQLASDLRVKGNFTFTIVIKFDEVPEIRIPVENDVVRADKATLPPGYSLTAAKVE
jgi:hypothetical protein